MIRIFTDNAANLPQELLERHAIRLVPLTYTIDGQAAPAEEFDGKQFYQQMRAGADVRTSMITPQTLRDAFEDCLRQGDDVIYLGISSGISGTLAAAQSAAAELSEQYPQRQVAAFDTRGASLGEGMQVLKAAQLAAEGASFAHILTRAQEWSDRMCQYFVVEDLTYLKRGGRISGAVALAGNFLNIKPLLRGDEQGHIVRCGGARGMRHAMAALAERYASLVSDNTLPVGIAHADNPGDTALLESLLRKQGFRGDVLSVCYEPVTGSHVGPGTVALFFWGVHR